MRGSSLLSNVSCADFKNWYDSCNLLHLPTNGSAFTWSNGRRGSQHTEKRLDRSLCNNDWLNLWSSATFCTLVRSKSDHYPILLTSNLNEESYPKLLSNS